METISRNCICCENSQGYIIPMGTYSIAGLENFSMNLKVCKSCGSVIQDPIPSQEVMRLYYEKLSNYTNVSRDGYPDDDSIAATNRQIRIIKEHIPNPSTVFEIGCATGYTLSQLQEIGWSVNGCDPSPSATKIAKSHWDINIQTGRFDDLFINSKNYGLVLISHVLEHVDDPVNFLQRAYNILANDGALLVEVPCLVAPEQWGNGYFTFEHVNFFSKNTLLNCLHKAGFTPEILEITETGNQYPVITVISKKSHQATASEIFIDPPILILELIRSYLSSERSEWNRIDQLIANEVTDTSEIIIWGGGIHTSQLFEKTTALKHKNIQFIIDSDPQKWGMQIGKHTIKSPNSLNYNNSNTAFIISSKAYENEIYEHLKKNIRSNVKILCLYSNQPNNQ